MEPLNDKMIVTLIKNAQQGKDVFEHLLRRYQHDVFRIIRVYTQNDSDAEDLAQETWVKVYRSIRKLKEPYHLESWLKKIAVNTAKDWLSSRAYKELQSTDEIQPQQLWGSAMLQYQRQQQIKKIRDAIDSLSAKNRQVVLDFYILGYSATQIGQRLNIPISTVNSRLKEARKQLRREFETMVAQSAIQEKFAPDYLVKNVMDRIESLPNPPPLSPPDTGGMKGGENIIQRIQRMLPKENLSIIGIATLIAFIVIGIISINLGNLQPSGNGNQNVNPTFGGGVWRKRADMPTARVDFSIAVVDGKIYTIGGGLRGAVEMYDAATDTWTQKASMPTPRVALSSGVVNEKIYAIGGWLGVPNQIFSTVEEYNPVTDTWTKKTNMPTPRAGFSTGVVNKKNYAIGGFDKDKVLSTVEEYDPATDTWTRKANMPTKRLGLAIGVVNGKIYAIGGKDDKALGAVEVYDPAQDTWEKKNDMPTLRAVFSASVVNGKIYAIGGREVASSVEVYEPATDTWTRETDVPTARVGHSSIAVNGKIYVFGTYDLLRGVLPTVEEYDTGFAVDAKEKFPTLWGLLKAWDGK